MNYKLLIVLVICCFIFSTISTIYKFRETDPNGYINKARYISLNGYSASPTDFFNGLDIHPPLYFFLISPLLIIDNNNIVFAIIQSIVVLLIAMLLYFRYGESEDLYTFSLCILIVTFSNLFYEYGSPRGLAILFILSGVILIERREYYLSSLLMILAVSTHTHSIIIIFIYYLAFYYFNRDIRYLFSLLFIVLYALILYYYIGIISTINMNIDSVTLLNETLFDIMSYSTFMTVLGVLLSIYFEVHSLVLIILLLVTQLGLLIGIMGFSFGVHVLISYLIIPILMISPAGLKRLNDIISERLVLVIILLGLLYHIYSYLVVFLV